MTQILQFFPGQVCTVYLETLNSDGYRADGYGTPLIERIILPSLTLAADYPAEMIHLDTGLYYYKFTLPTGATSLGSYLIDGSWVRPDNGFTYSQTWQVIVNAPYGNFGVVTTI